MKSLVSNIPAGDGKKDILFLQCIVGLLTLILNTFAPAMNIFSLLTTKHQLYKCKQNYNILSRIIIQFSVEKYNTRCTTSDVSIENNIFPKGIMKNHEIVILQIYISGLELHR
jgi:hypothetical protein